MLRGSSLKNTEYVTGMCVFTGHDTKVMKNSASSKYKFSRLEIHMNKALVIVFCLQFVLAAIAAVIGATWIIDVLHDAEDPACGLLPNKIAADANCSNAYYLGYESGKNQRSLLFYLI